VAWRTTSRACPATPTQIGRFRRVLGEAGVEQLLKSTIEASVSMGLLKKAEFEHILVDTTVQLSLLGDHERDAAGVRPLRRPPLPIAMPDRLPRRASAIGMQT
jgi:hypothetical protein